MSTSRTIFDDPRDEGPPEPRVGAGGRYPTNEWVKPLVKLREIPGQWRVIAEFQNADTGKKMWSSLRNGQRAIPSGPYEFEYNPTAEGGVKLYARYMGGRHDPWEVVRVDKNGQPQTISRRAGVVSGVA